MDSHMPALVKILTKLTKEHLAGQAPADSASVAVSGHNAGAPVTVPAQTPQSSPELLKLALGLISARVAVLQDQRRWFLVALVQLVERSHDLKLCRFLLETLADWCSDDQASFPTIKEKAGILAKMMAFEQRNDPALLAEYLALILRIYTNPAFARTELTVRLENAFLLGCRSPDPELRSQFMAVFDRTLARSLSARMHYILGQQNWEFLADTYWLQPAFDLLLGSVDVEQSMDWSAADDISSDGAAEEEKVYSPELGLISCVRGLLYTDPSTLR